MSARKETRHIADTSRVFLIGFSGCGKSTIGPRLAARLKARFCDSDELIEKQTGRKVSELFRDEGERRFRALESEVIRRLMDGSQRKVIALGGGAFSDAENRALVKQGGLVVYLSCPVQELYRRLRLKTDRPLLEGQPAAGETERQAKLRRIGALLKKRRKHYHQAHIRVSTANKSVLECVNQVYRKMKGLHARLAR